jgi:2-amino-4-hydroxy-6-hydroxymethyldihydropteridine diphosphokinase
VIAASSLYETEPQDGAVGQEDFLNACLAVETKLDPDALLEVCKDVERALGRSGGGERHAPRTIDVDVLLLGELEHRSERLVLPHPDLARRRFVLEPLLELDPELALPDGTPLGPVLARLESQRVERVGPF